MANILNVKDANGQWVGIPSIQGYSAYELACKKGYTGTLDEWLESLVGPKGDKGADGVVTFESLTAEQKASLKGDKGDPGEKGADGAQGPKGDKGDPGADGAKGEKGDTGAQGPAGTNGAKGDKGDIGPQGPAGKDGAQGPKGDKGDPGATYTITAADYDAIADVVISKFGNAEDGEF